MACDSNSGSGTTVASLWTLGMVAILSPSVLWFSSPLVGWLGNGFSICMWWLSQNNSQKDTVEGKVSMVTNYVTDRMEVNISKPVDIFVISSVKVPAAIQTEMDALREEWGVRNYIFSTTRYYNWLLGKLPLSLNRLILTWRVIVYVRAICERREFSAATLHH